MFCWHSLLVSEILKSKSIISLICHWNISQFCFLDMKNHVDAKVSTFCISWVLHEIATNDDHPSIKSNPWSLDLLCVAFNDTSYILPYVSRFVCPYIFFGCRYNSRVWDILYIENYMIIFNFGCIIYVLISNSKYIYLIIWLYYKFFLLSHGSSPIPDFTDFRNLRWKPEATGFSSYGHVPSRVSQFFRACRAGGWMRW